MRLLSTLEWRNFFETVSLIDRELAKDPARIYSRMDFATRDRYRKVVERIGKRAKVKELDVARAALRLAEAASTESGNPTVREGANARAAPPLRSGFSLPRKRRRQMVRRARKRTSATS